MFFDQIKFRVEGKGTGCSTWHEGRTADCSLNRGDDSHHKTRLNAAINGEISMFCYHNHHFEPKNIAISIFLGLKVFQIINFFQ